MMRFFTNHVIKYRTADRSLQCWLTQKQRQRVGLYCR